MSSSAVAAAMPWAESAHIPPALGTEIERRIHKALGIRTSSLRTVSWVPWFAEADARMGAAMPIGIPHHLAQLIGLVVSQDNACRHCYGTTRAMLRVAGMSERLIRKLESDLHTAPLTDREQAALEYARRVSRAAPRTGPADLTRLQEAGFTAGEAVEITFIAAAVVFCNRVATLLAIQPEPVVGLIEGPFGWIARPLLRLMMGRKQFHYPPVPVPPGTTTAVDALFVALEGVPGRDNLRRTVVDAQESSVTTPRQKALVMAVIAAGLDCHLCARGSRDVLRREGFPETEVDDMVTHLASPRLDPFEVNLMRFARETVRYRPEMIHARCKEFFRGIEPAVAVEVVGLCALANMLGRLSVLLPR